MMDRNQKHNRKGKVKKTAVNKSTPTPPIFRDDIGKESLTHLQTSESKETPYQNIQDGEKPILNKGNFFIAISPYINQ